MRFLTLSLFFAALAAFAGTKQLHGVPCLTGACPTECQCTVETHLESGAQYLHCLSFDTVQAGSLKSGCCQSLNPSCSLPACEVIGTVFTLTSNCCGTLGNHFVPVQASTAVNPGYTSKQLQLPSGAIRSDAYKRPPPYVTERINADAGLLTAIYDARHKCDSKAQGEE